MSFFGSDCTIFLRHGVRVPVPLYPYQHLVWISFLVCLFVCFLRLSCMSSFYIWGINSLSDVSLANIFSHSVCGFFTLLIAPFATQELFSLIQFCLFIFAFFFSCLKETYPKQITKTDVQECTKFSSRILGFQASCLSP